MGQRYTEAELLVRMKVTIGLALAFCLVGIVFVILWSLLFVTQPIGYQSPNDAEFFKLITPIATFLTGILSGIMLGKGSEQPEKKEEPGLEPHKEPLSLDDDEIA